MNEIHPPKIYNGSSPVYILVVHVILRKSAPETRNDSLSTVSPNEVLTRLNQLFQDQYKMNREFQGLLRTVPVF